MHSLMSYPYCWISKHNSVNLTSGSSVMWEMLLVCYMPAEDHGREKGIQRVWHVANASQIPQCTAEWSPAHARREYDLICAERDFLHMCPLHSTAVGVYTALQTQAHILSPRYRKLLTDSFCLSLALGREANPSSCGTNAGDYICV